MTNLTTPKSHNESNLSQQNIVLKDIQFSSKINDKYKKAQLKDIDKDFLNRLDEEIKQTEQSVKQMNDRFDQLQIRG